MLKMTGSVGKVLMSGEDRGKGARIELDGLDRRWLDGFLKLMKSVLKVQPPGVVKFPRPFSSITMSGPG